MVSHASAYVHGYAPEERIRLEDQASALANMLHGGTTFAPGTRILEVGCGVGAQTVTLAGNSPQAQITAIDISAPSLAAAAERVRKSGLTNVRFIQANLFDLPFGPASFDHIFVCFVLEHLARPLEALRCIREVLRPGGTITVIEGDHGTACLHPESAAARKAIGALVALQAANGGDANIGRRLYPLLVEAGFREIEVSLPIIHSDGSRPDVADIFTRRTFIAMVEGAREQAVSCGLIDAESFEEGLNALDRAAGSEGTFSYTFAKATARTRRA